MKTISVTILTTLLMISLFSCKKDDKPTPETPKITSGAYVLNEGSFNGNNTTLTYYDFATATATTDYYKNANGSGLGDTGNDMIIYGGKLYIVMNVSSYVEVADASTAKSIKKIPMMNNAPEPQPISPRYATAYKGKVFVSCWNGTVAVIDTLSLNVEKFVKVGANPEQLVISGNNLYVANSGGLTPGFDSTVSVIDLGTLTETSRIVVGTNPTAIEADNAGNIFVGCNGNYGSIGPKLVRVSIASKAVVATTNIGVADMVFNDGKLYITGGYLGLPNVQTISPADLSILAANFVTDGTQVMVPYALSIDEASGDVYVGDAVDYFSAGRVFCFDKNGKKKFSFSVAPGINPNTIVFIRK